MAKHKKAASVLPIELILQIVEYIYHQFLEERELDRRSPRIRPFKKPPSAVKSSTLLRLRATSKTFRAAVDRYLFSDLVISEFSSRANRRLSCYRLSSSIFEAVRTCSIAPYVIVARPIVRWRPESYCLELAGGYGHHLQPRLSALRAVHEARIQVAKLYDEQASIVWPDYNSVTWYASRLLHHVTGYQTDSLKPHLADSVFFRGLEQMLSLTRLELSYPVTFSPESEMVMATKTEMSIGLGRYLGSSPRMLTSIEINFASLFDVELLANTIDSEQSYYATPGLIRILSLQLSIIPNAEPQMDIWTPPPDGTSPDLFTKSEPVNEFLALMPNLEEKNVVINESYYAHLFV